MDDHLLNKFAELILKGGINIQEGQCISVAAEPIHWPFINLLERKAYELGAKFVKTDLNHPQSDLNKANYRKSEYLDYIPEYTKSMVDTFVDNKWSFIRFDGKEDLDLLKKMDQKANAVTMKATLIANKPLNMARMEGACT